MKGFLLFLAGVVTGMGLIIGFAFLYNGSNEGITMFEQPGECIGSERLNIIQALDGGALAMEYSYGIPVGPVVFLLNKDDNGYYDDQVVDIPKGQCARQVGIYKYISKEGVDKTVPVVKIGK